MRAFLAIAPSDTVKGNLTAAVRRLEPAATGVTWCGRDQFHLTLAFLGEISPAILPHVTSAMERVCATHAAFVCRAYGFGFFGSKRNPKTLWAGVDPSAPLDSLYEDLWTALKKFGYATEDKHFRPHITLGRCREAERNMPLIEAMDADETIDFGTWDVRRVTLYESRLTPKGPHYRVLAHAALGL